MLKAPSDPNSVPMLIFGIAYLTIGVLLIKKVRFDTLLGIIVPVIGLCVGFFVVGIKNWTAMLSFLFTIDAVVIVCCVILMVRKDVG